MDFKKRLWRYDLLTGGDLFSRIRHSRDITQQEIAERCNVDVASISRFERGSQIERLEDYLAVLTSRDWEAPLTQAEVEPLRAIYQGSLRTKRAEHETNFSQLRFDMILSPRYPRLRKLLCDLEHLDRPAFIMDASLSIHALNSFALRLFSIDPAGGHLRRWEGWHSLGGKFYTSSPVNAAHINADEYFGQTIAVLFQSQLTQPYWFTRQMRLLIFRLYKMSNEVHYPFARVWYATTSFSHPFRSQEVTRSLYYCFTSEEWEHIHTDTDIVDMTEEEIVPGVWLPFVLAAWQPNGSDAKRAFADMQKHIQRNDIYFAAQYDTNPPSFHVNTWSEILRS